MKTGFIGAGRVGCSIGKYLSESGIPLAGYYDAVPEAACDAAAFTASKSFASLEALVQESSLVFLTTPDSMIERTWEEIRPLPIAGKLVCHCSGALPSDAFTGIQNTGAAGCSFHPMLPFHDRYASYSQLKHAFFTIEGDDKAVQALSALFTKLGNTVCRIEGAYKPTYHAAASILSNQVIAVLDTGYRLLEECGFSREAAIDATKELVRQNIENVLAHDCVQALTGPIDRCDLTTVQKHLDCLHEEDLRMYQVLGSKLLKLAEKKNPGQDYAALHKLLQHAAANTEYQSTGASQT
ncbi:MAG: DUF2520 domain-containing protein [Eubacterium sp.]|nr:DUF2520 domain-containing protein [Eubacterium sp.]